MLIFVALRRTDIESAPPPGPASSARFRFSSTPCTMRMMCCGTALRSSSPSCAFFFPPAAFFTLRRLGSSNESLVSTGILL